MRENWIKLKSDFFRSIINLNSEAIIARYNEIYPNKTINIAKAIDLLRKIKIIKIADVAANLRETVVDLTNGVDGVIGKNGLTDLSWRIEDFRARIELIEQQFDPKFPLLPQMKVDLNFLEVFII